MSKHDILKILEQNRGEVISGITLSEELNLSRNSIWKGINALREEGYLIESVKNKGYRLLHESDSLSESEIKLYLKNKDFSIIIKDELPSTNTYLKENKSTDFKNNTLVIAKSQSGGRGRLGKSFYSEDKSGIYMSLLKKEDLNQYDISLITIAAALCISEVLDSIAGIETRIKWVNDIYFQGKKLSGILTEGSMEFETGSLEYFIIGIGINVNTEAFPEEIKDIASSLSIQTKKKYRRNEIIARILDSLEGYLLMTKTSPELLIESYRKKMLYLDQEIVVLRGNETFNGILRGINDQGHLIIERDGKLITQNSGEISIRKTV
jgi:BirA family biotin operon repressor/biotin-[acetyl-CoA-carboxylase] ligase